MEFIVQFIPLILIFAVFYFLLIRPQQRRAKMHRDMVSAMQRGDKVITAGGLRAKVVKVVNETDVELEISPNVNVVVLKATVSDVIKSYIVLVKIRINNAAFFKVKNYINNCCFYYCNIISFTKSF